MCGIAGIMDMTGRAPVDTDCLRRMIDRLFHRGPDDMGYLVERRVGLAMRRLSIIDLATGQQPIHNEDKTLSVVFNGEIYNYRELRAELQTKGHRFSTTSDSEVLVHLYEEHRERCVERLRGMFAFAIWDRQRQAGLEAYLQYGYVPEPLSILEGVRRLPPGHTLTVKDGSLGAPRRYWKSTGFFRSVTGPSRDSEADASESLWGHLESAVRSHLVSDVPVGAFLSGGVDSSAVVAIMAQAAGVPVKTFSVGFRESGYNELPYARRVAESLGTEHHELLVEPRDLGVLEEVLAAVDEPFADASAIPTYLVSRLARRHVKVVLSGDGGDELFAGYDRYVVDHQRRHLGLLGDAGLGGVLRVLSAGLPEGAPGKNYLYNLSLPRLHRYLDSISLFPAREMANLLEPAVVPHGESPFATALALGNGLDPLSRLQDLDLNTYLPGDILTKVDRMSMANSLEARVPLLDHPLVEFACGLPADLRFRAGQTKHLLKRTLRGRVPEEVLTRPKQGFGVPLELWFTERLPGFFQDLLGDGRRLVDVGVRPAAVRKLMEAFARSHRKEYCQRLWALVVLDRALRRMGEVGAT
ncbi:MAG: asparagine synthase (glutamine-hydrolyzing) [Candidatus Rokubacteria bacterium 13_1_20CM_4_68_9]|nr:MAG: asparagine synthase (glutamine-hydrolyzing) [Candidatus Rokubacteria bacterium 13_1_20CM_4_68_9]